MDDKNTELQVLGPESLAVIHSAEIDRQIATAHQYPRSMQQFKTRALEMATLDEETAASCLYSRPVGGGKFAEGLSIRTAEIVGASYGNLRVYAEIIEMTPKFVKARGVAHDLESNFASSSEVIEPTLKKDGTPYDERMRMVIAKAACAKARRDATFQVVPKALCKFIESAARKVIVGDAASLDKRRAQAMQWVNKLSIDPKRVFKALGVNGEAEIGLEELVTLTGIRTAIKDQEVTIDEAFPAEQKPKPATVSKTPAPEITKRDQLRNLIKGSGITESQVCAYKSELSIDGMSDETVSDLIEFWANHAPEIMNQGKE